MGLIKTFKIGAMPIIQGVVARGRNNYAIALEKTNGNILLKKGKINFISSKPIIFIRGIISMFETGALWVKSLLYSGNYFDEEQKDFGDLEVLAKEEYLKKQDRIKAENSQSWLVFGVIFILLLCALFGFFMLPVFISSLFFDNVVENNWIFFNVVECVSRLLIFIIYFAIFKSLGGKFAKIRNFHCAINKTINCFEAEKELSVGSVKLESKFTPRSTDFIMFLAVLICSVATIFIKMEGLVLALIIRLGIFILSVGVAYEISRLFGMFNGKFSRALAMIFGMWIEVFTVSEPTYEEYYIVITAVKNSMIEE